MANHVLGTGALTWDKGERIDDRYGVIYLGGTDSKGGHISDVSFDKALAAKLADRGARGKLIAVVREARKSTHVGDHFHSVFPETPEVGETIELSEVGTFVIEPSWESEGVGIAPDDGRTKMWMDIKALYRAHEQTVELIFVEE